MISETEKILSVVIPLCHRADLQQGLNGWHLLKFVVLLPQLLLQRRNLRLPDANFIRKDRMHRCLKEYSGVRFARGLMGSKVHLRLEILGFKRTFFVFALPQPRAQVLQLSQQRSMNFFF
jgi:hypothetical protein